MRYATFLLFLSFIVLDAAFSTKYTNPASVTFSLDVDRAAKRLTISINYSTGFKFTQGRAYLGTADSSGAPPDSLLLWEGNDTTSTGRFTKSFKRTIRLVNDRAYFRAGFSFWSPVLNRTCSNIVYQEVHVLPDTVLNAYSREVLEYHEVLYLIKKRGYENVPDWKIPSLDPELAERMRRVNLLQPEKK